MKEPNLKYKEKQSVQHEIENWTFYQRKKYCKRNQYRTISTLQFYISIYNNLKNKLIRHIEYNQVLEVHLFNDRNGGMKHLSINFGDNVAKPENHKRLGKKKNLKIRIPVWISKENSHTLSDMNIMNSIHYSNQERPRNLINILS